MYDINEKVEVHLWEYEAAWEKRRALIKYIYEQRVLEKLGFDAWLQFAHTTTLLRLRAAAAEVEVEASRTPTWRKIALTPTWRSRAAAEATHTPPPKLLPRTVLTCTIPLVTPEGNPCRSLSVGVDLKMQKYVLYRKPRESTPVTVDTPQQVVAYVRLLLSSGEVRPALAR